MQRIKIPDDGNCFFVSLATMIQQQLEKGTLNAAAKTHLENLGLIQDVNIDIKQMATALTQTIVNEWLANSSSYEAFLTSGQDYKSEASAFLLCIRTWKFYASSCLQCITHLNCGLHSNVKLPSIADLPQR